MKVLVELEYEEVKTLEILLEVIEHISVHGSLPRHLESTAKLFFSPVADVEESELKANRTVGFAKLHNLREKLKAAGRMAKN